jgi:carbonic anhydrase/acetyltransferase-like protein (isoleucine patch superfamily)
MAIYELDGVSPTLGKDAYVADSAQVMGDVVLGEGASLWFGVIARGDSEKITIGRGSNIQDGSVLHADAGKPLVIGDNVSVGHMVMLHGCSVGDGSLIGIGAIVLNDAKIGKNDGSMIMGSPAKLVRALAPEQIAGVHGIGGHYVANGKRFKAGLKKIG